MKHEVLFHYPDLHVDKNGVIALPISERKELELRLIADPSVHCNEGYFGATKVIESMGTDCCADMMSVTIKENEE